MIDGLRSLPREHGATLSALGMTILGPLCAAALPPTAILVALGSAAGLLASLSLLGGERPMALAVISAGLFAAAFTTGPWSMLPFAAGAAALGALPVAAPAAARRRRLIPMAGAFLATAMVAPLTFVAAGGSLERAVVLMVLTSAYLLTVLLAVRRRLGVRPDGGPLGAVAVTAAGMALTALVALAGGAVSPWVCLALAPGLGRLPAGLAGRDKSLRPRTIGLLELGLLTLFVVLTRLLWPGA